MTTTSISIQAVQDHPLPEQSPGTVIGGRFEVLSKLGEGMLGAVYCVRNNKTNEKYALKLMRPKLVADDLDVNRFNHEIQLAKQFDHPCIAKVFDSGEHDGTLYFTMELVEGGESLRHLIDRYKSRGEDLPVEEVHDIIDGVLEGLAHAHEVCIHRDLKPENILLYDEKDAEGQLIRKVKLTDFAIANIVSPTIFATSYLNREGAFYLAPEMNEFRDKAAPNSDLYSLGAVLYEMLLGDPPIGRYEMPSDIRSGELTTGIDDLIEIALAPNPQDRFQSAADMRNASDQAFSDVYASAETNWQRTAMLLAILALLSVVAIVSFLEKRETLAEVYTADQLHRETLLTQIANDNGELSARPATSDPRYEDMAWIPGGYFIRGKVYYRTGGMLRAMDDDLSVSKKLRRGLTDVWRDMGKESAANEVARGYARSVANSKCVADCKGADRTACINSCDTALPDSAIDGALAGILEEVSLDKIADIILEAEVTDFNIAGKSELDEELVNVPGFFIDKQELHYQLKTAGEEDSEEDIEKIEHWNSTIAGEPVQNITWSEAKLECERSSKRLCSEVEWEKACKGPSNDTFSYGSEYQSGTCLASGFTAGDRVAGKAACASDWGVFGLSGGVREWTASGQGSNYVVKPGTIGSDAVGTRCAGRDDRAATFSQVHIGARCCADVGSANSAPAAGEAAPAEGEAAPAEGEAAPAEGEAAPAEGEAAPGEGEAAPAEGEAAPAEGEAAPAEGEAAPAEGEAAPAEGGGE